MKGIKNLTLALVVLTVLSCNKENNVFPTDKRYWDINDYNKVVRELNYGYEKDDMLPTFDDPNTKIIVEKLTDKQNFNIVLEDNELGLKHRNEIAEKFFNEWKNMTTIYNVLDRKDQYLYEDEMLAVWHFGLELQLKYFKLGNEQVEESADDPNAPRVKSNINSNVNTLIKNYLIYLDEINNEDAFSEAGKSKLAQGIDNYFPKLINLYPESDFNAMKSKAELLSKKTNSEKIKVSLNNIIALIDSNYKKEKNEMQNH
ncbi:hypothetical protein [Paenimyroides aestuarii]|uniref:Lipoprotein n=1 Tax=Paenimyroides aestuarii TaxID=2968490 RepID=A0ABY5NT12_9FLAO|nr:hypothetical protein [Paenimyroides aestuarii]UUV21675.1 hypothetical protein NPX36_01085 [Paenimyroides aestuarii]